MQFGHPVWWAGGNRQHQQSIKAVRSWNMRCQKGKHLSLSASLLKCPQARRWGRHTSSKFTSCSFNSLNVCFFLNLEYVIEGSPLRSVNKLCNFTNMLSLPGCQIRHHGQSSFKLWSYTHLSSIIVACAWLYGQVSNNKYGTSSLLLWYYSEFWSVNVVKR